MSCNQKKSKNNLSQSYQIHASWNGKPLCTADANGTVRFSPDDIRGADEDRQRLFSDEQLGVIRNACEFALEDDITLSYAEEKLLRSVQEQIGQLLPEQSEQRPTMEQSRGILEAAFLLQEKGMKQSL